MLSVWTVLVSGCGYLIPAHNQTTVAAELPAGAYALDSDHAALLFKVSHLGFSKTVGRFNRFDASLDFDRDAPAASDLTVVIETGSIDMTLDPFEETLRGPEWLDAETHPLARFDSSEIILTGDDTGQIIGDFTLLGVTRPITLDVTFNGGAPNLVSGKFTLGFEAHGAFKRSDFGMTTLLPAIGDTVELEIHAEFVRDDARRTAALNLD